MEGTLNLKPFYFFVVVWGKTYLSYLTEYCIPSLLSQNNIPALDNDHKKNKFLFCCPIEDWNHLICHESFKILKNYLTPVHLEISPPPTEVSDCLHMGMGHKLATQRCFEDKVYGVGLTPDMMLSDGALKTVQEKARIGKQIIYCAALRFEEESTFKQLQALGYNPITNNYPCIQLSARELTKIALTSLHRETISYNLDLPFLKRNVPSYFKLIQEEGILLHTLSWCPLLLDYSAITIHDTSTFDHWTFDGDYVNKNFYGHCKVYACQDSDEMMVLTWTPKDKNYGPLITKPFLKYKWLRKIYYTYLIRSVFYNDIFDNLKLQLFPLPVYIHKTDMHSIEWQTHEKYFQTIISKELELFKYLSKNPVKKPIIKILYFIKKTYYIYSQKILIIFRLLFLAIKICLALIGHKTYTKDLKNHAKYGNIFRIMLFYIKV